MSNEETNSRNLGEDNFIDYTQKIGIRFFQ